MARIHMCKCLQQGVWGKDDGFWKCCMCLCKVADEVSSGWKRGKTGSCNEVLIFGDGDA